MSPLFADLARICAPAIATETLAAVVSLESGFSPFAIRIDSGPPLGKQPKSRVEAIQTAASLIAGHQQIDLGLGGISAEQFGALGITVADAFDPCSNLKATARLLKTYYRAAVDTGASPSAARKAMLRSYYGRGESSIGAMAGFDAQVRREVMRVSPELSSLRIDGAGEGNLNSEGGKGTTPTPVPTTTSPPQPHATQVPWDVFSAEQTSSVLIFQDHQPEQER